MCGVEMVWCWGCVVVVGVVWCWGVGLSGLKSGALEALKAIATLCLADNTHDRVNQFGTLCVKSLGRVVVCTGLPPLGVPKTRDEVV